jgi:hypothetical protein
MKKPMVKFGKGEIGRVRIVGDFLPPPDNLMPLTEAQVAEVQRRRNEPDAGKLTLKEFKVRLRRRFGD